MEEREEVIGGTWRKETVGDQLTQCRFEGSVTDGVPQGKGEGPVNPDMSM